MKNLALKARLSVLGFLEFAVWGSYLTSLGAYLALNGLGENTPTCRSKSDAKDSP